MSLSFHVPDPVSSSVLAGLKATRAQKTTTRLSTAMIRPRAGTQHLLLFDDAGHVVQDPLSTVLLSALFLHNDHVLSAMFDFPLQPPVSALPPPDGQNDQQQQCDDSTNQSVGAFDSLLTAPVDFNRLLFIRTVLSPLRCSFQLPQTFVLDFCVGPVKEITSRSHSGEEQAPGVVSIQDGTIQVAKSPLFRNPQRVTTKQAATIFPHSQVGYFPLFDTDKVLLFRVEKRNELLPIRFFCEVEGTFYEVSSSADFCVDDHSAKMSPARLRLLEHFLAEREQYVAAMEKALSVPNAITVEALLLCRRNTTAGGDTTNPAASCRLVWALTDLLTLNGMSFADKPFDDRWRLLDRQVIEIEGEISVEFNSFYPLPKGVADRQELLQHKTLELGGEMKEQCCGEELPGTTGRKDPLEPTPVLGVAIVDRRETRGLSSKRDIGVIPFCPVVIPPATTQSTLAILGLFPSSARSGNQGRKRRGKSGSLQQYEGRLILGSLSPHSLPEDPQWIAVCSASCDRLSKDLQARLYGQLESTAVPLSSQKLLTGERDFRGYSALLPNDVTAQLMIPGNISCTSVVEATIETDRGTVVGVVNSLEEEKGPVEADTFKKLFSGLRSTASLPEKEIIRRYFDALLLERGSPAIPEQQELPVRTTKSSIDRCCQQIWNRIERLKHLLVGRDETTTSRLTPIVVQLPTGNGTSGESPVGVGTEAVKSLQEVLLSSSSLKGMNFADPQPLFVLLSRAAIDSDQEGKEGADRMVLPCPELDVEDEATGRNIHYTLTAAVSVKEEDSEGGSWCSRAYLRVPSRAASSSQQQTVENQWYSGTLPPENLHGDLDLEEFDGSLLEYAVRSSDRGLTFRRVLQSAPWRSFFGEVLRCRNANDVGLLPSRLLQWRRWEELLTAGCLFVYHPCPDHHQPSSSPSLTSTDNEASVRSPSVDEVLQSDEDLARNWILQMKKQKKESVATIFETQQKLHIQEAEALAQRQRITVRYNDSTHPDHFTPSY